MSERNDVQKLAVAWFYLEQFGFSRPPSQTDPEVVRNMAVALLTAANGDGNLSDAERAWITGYFAAKGYPAEVIEEMRGLNPTEVGAVPGLMEKGILRQSGRILVYDAIRAASIDGYNAGERKAVREVASMLGIEAEVVDELERLVEDEEVVRARRIHLLMPAGHPNLDPKYKR